MECLPLTTIAFLLPADLNKSLLDLGLLNRQALVVVPHRITTGFQGLRSSADQRNSAPTEASTGSSGGYFAYIKSFLSYVNPFSYLGGSASSSTTGQESQGGIWEYGELLFCLCQFFILLG